MAVLAAVLLCGGKGSRMMAGGVTTHKPLLEVGGMPSTRFVIEGLLGGNLEFSQFIVVVPPGREKEYEEALSGLECRIVVQECALGTGNAVYESLEHLLAPIEHVYVSFGTQPLVRTETIEGSLDVHIQQDLGFTLATVIMDNPYAPLLRDSEGVVCGSIETHLEGAEMPENGETNIGAYWVSRSALDVVLRGLHDELYDIEKGRYATNSGELGFPNEMVRGCLTAGLGVDGVPIATEIEMMGIKTPETLDAIRDVVGVE
ncbi:MAG: NTP transferase domain-containing protein [Candidatus Thalassarchaeaceae archaeon]|jgi:bifunctional N-acetylglucosamine-1-phosphate-uridyltransferase/glucosamine-1-phosphate-acetyltransferase GlmU-like protein|nr:NTP transferase domain-containing protein [Candidatus Thalassarchaeaceae archaeon]